MIEITVTPNGVIIERGDIRVRIEEGVKLAEAELRRNLEADIYGEQCFEPLPECPLKMPIQSNDKAWISELRDALRARGGSGRGREFETCFAAAAWNVIDIEAYRALCFLRDKGLVELCVEPHRNLHDWQFHSWRWLSL